MGGIGVFYLTIIVASPGFEQLAGLGNCDDREYGLGELQILQTIGRRDSILTTMRPGGFRGKDAIGSLHALR